MALQELFPFAESDLKAILPPSKRARIDFREGYILAMIPFPVYDPETKRVSSSEADFLITDKHLITVTREDSPALERFLNGLKHGDSAKLASRKSPMHLALTCFQAILNSQTSALEIFAERVDGIERRLFEKRLHGSTVLESTHLNLAFLQMLKLMKPIREALAELEEQTEPSLRNKAEETRELADHICTLIESDDAVLDELQRTYDSLVSMRTNAIVKTLTVFSVMLLPLNAIASIFGMNFKNIPLVDDTSGFFVLVTFMVVLIVCMGVLFRRKRWL